MHEEISAAAKASPAVGGVVYSTLTLNDYAALATLIYVVLQIILLIPKYRTAFPKLWAKAKAWLSGKILHLRLRLNK